MHGEPRAHTYCYESINSHDTSLISEINDDFALLHIMVSVLYQALPKT